MDPSDLLSGTPFRMLAQRGSDEITEFLLAETRDGGAPVLVKLLRSDAEQQLEARDRFFRETWALEQLRHPHIVVAKGSGWTGAGRAYLAFEALEGKRLHYALESGLSQADAVDAMCQLLNALSYMHALGVVHRDVRPENILLGKPRSTDDTGPGRKIMLLNFGLVQIGDDDAIPGAALVVAIPFADRAYRGSPHFAAPEQALGGRVDARADVYAVGAVLYTLLTGHLLFDGCATEEELREAQLHRVPDAPSARRPGASSPDLDRIVMRALAKDPCERPQNADELRELLDRVLGRTVAPAPAHASPVQQMALSGARPTAAPPAAQTTTADKAIDRGSLVIFVLAVVTFAVAVMLGVGWTLLRFLL